MTVLYAYAVFYYVTAGIAVGGLASWFWNIYPTYAPYVIIPGLLSWVAKKGAEYMVFKQKKKAVEDAIATYQTQQLHPEFDNDETTNKTEYMN